jgi:fructose-1,6-bisphosphatase/inositol monophosphatase family enzyme
MTKKPKPDALSILLDVDLISAQLKKLHTWIAEIIHENATNAFEPAALRRTGKDLVYVDWQAERDFGRTLQHLVGPTSIEVLGEESLVKGKNLADQKGHCVLLDMVDGTDLLQRGFSNWCSAIVVFYPIRSRIEGAFVAFPDQTLYFASEKEDGAYKTKFRGKPSPREAASRISIPKKPTSLRDASVCIYAQKSGALLKVLERFNQSPKLLKLLENNVARDKADKGSVGFRFYNLAGNPMMARLAEGTVDAVIDLAGQQPHDFAAGVFIAMKAGAVLGNLNERKLYSY